MSIDSSDFGDLPPEEELDEFTSAGDRLSKVILDNQATDRLLTKRSARNVKLSMGAPGVRRKQAAVAKALPCFMQSLGKPPHSCPGPEEIFRFVATLILRIRPRHHDKPSPSITTVRDYWYYLVRHCDFSFGQEFRRHYDRQVVLKINAHLDQEFRRGHLTRGLWEKRRYVGIMALQNMGLTYLRKAVRHGCQSIDIVVQRWLGVLLQSSCVGRPGDVARTNGYKASECLCYSDIVLQLRPGGTTVNDLSATVTLRYTKGKKFDSNDDKVLFWEPIRDPALNPMCAIKLCLIHALRHGNCHGKTIEETIQHTMMQGDRRVVWRHPDRPVLMAIHPKRRGFLLEDQPAGTQQITRSVRLMALVCGIVDPISARHLRNGAVRDLSHLQSRPAGTPDHFVRRSAGHSMQSFNSGVTDHYSGPTQTDTMVLRTKEPLQDWLAPAVDTSKAQGSVLRVDKRRVLVLNPSQQNLKITTGHSERNTTGPHKRPRSPSPVAPDVIDPRLRGTGGGTALPDIGNESGLTVAEADDVDACDEAQLRLVSDLVLGIPTKPAPDQGETRPIETEDVNETDGNDDTTALLPDLASLFDDSTEPWPDDPMAFVNFWARHNEYLFAQSHGQYDHKDQETVRDRVPTGNSRADPTRYAFRCRKGCPFQTFTKHHLMMHEPNCRGPSTLPEEAEVDKLGCPYDDCNSLFPSQPSLAQHITIIHNFEPRTCNRGCVDGHIYNSKAEFVKHLERVHTDWEPQQCPKKTDCHSETFFVVPSTLKAHLVAQHQMSYEEIRQSVPEVYRSEESKPWHPTRCPLEACTSLSMFDTPNKLRKHLRTTHDYSAAEAEELAPLERIKALLVDPPTKPTEKKQRIFDCPVDPKCDRKFDSITTMQKHLMTKVHGNPMASDKALELAEETMGRKKKKAVASTTAPQDVAMHCPKCRYSQVTFKKPGILKAHLINTHRVEPGLAHELTEETFGRKIIKRAPRSKQ